jgi:hypothetical protein
MSQLQALLTDLKEIVNNLEQALKQQKTQADLFFLLTV